MLFSANMMKFLLSLTAIFNIIDIIVSIKIIKFGSYEENNPIMKYLLDIGIMPFIIFKISLISFGIYVLWTYKDKLLAQIGAYISFSFYWALICMFYYFLTFN